MNGWLQSVGQATHFGRATESVRVEVMGVIVWAMTQREGKRPEGDDTGI